MKVSSYKDKQKKWYRYGGEWIYSIFSAACIAACIRWAIAGLYIVSSGSMEQTLLTGDCVLVSKLHYGARTPVTPLQLPMTHRLIPGTRLPAYLNWIQLPPFRLPGWSAIQRNDIVVLNTTEDILGVPMDLHDYWIKRCVAIAGDVIKIQHKELYINDLSSDMLASIQYHYFMRTKRILPQAFFDKNGIKSGGIHSTIVGQEGYHVYATPAKVKQLKQVLSSSVLSVDLVGEQEGMGAQDIYPWHAHFPWNKDNFGPFQVPKKGMTIPMDASNMILYRDIIQKFEGRKEVQFLEDGCWIDGVQAKTYTFQKNYYFVMGDNRDQSKDSRFIGCIPEDYIVGKAVMTLVSSGGMGGMVNFFRQMRWDRLFQPLST